MSENLRFVPIPVFWIQHVVSMILSSRMFIRNSCIEKTKNIERMNEIIDAYYAHNLT